MIWLYTILGVTSAMAAWTDSPRYSKDYTDTSSKRFARCIPCEQRMSQLNIQSQSGGQEYRGNGADNLGYDWSPKAWGGRAFPSKEEEKGQLPEDAWNNRDGRRMPWNEKCRDCERSKNWNQFTDKNKDGNFPTHRPGSWSASSERPQIYGAHSDTPKDGLSTVTSSVLGVRLRDDKRLPVEWSEDSRSMRWDGFRNGMPWQKPDSMDKRDDSFRSWGGNDPGSSRWNQDGRGSYASEWNYGDRYPDTNRPNTNEPRPWGNRWTDKNDGSDRRYNQGSSGFPFGSSYPQTDRYPAGPSYSTSSYPQKPDYHYSGGGRPQSQYPTESPGARPTYEAANNRPSQNTDNPYKPQSQTPSWSNRPENSLWTTPRPNQNYLPQNTRPSSYPNYDYDNSRPSNNPSHNYGDSRPNPNYGSQSNNRPYDGTPGTAIWNGRPGNSNKKPQGFYTGFITEIHDPNYGSKYPPDRPNSGGNNYDQSNFNEGSRWPSYNSNTLPNNYDRYPNRPQGSERPYDGNKNPTYGNPYDGQRNPSYDRPNEGNRNPGNNIRPNGYPETNFDNRDPSYGHESPNKFPNYNYDRNQDRDWNYGNDRPYDQRDPNRRPAYDNNRDYNRQPSYGTDRDTRPYGSSSDRYPSRPSSGEHDSGPNQGSASGSWNYGDEDKDGTYRRSGGSYPLYKGGQYYTSSYLASASTPAAAAQDPPNIKSTDDTTVSSLPE